MQLNGQLALPFKAGRGGRRANAGRRRAPGPRRVAHRRRAPHCGRHPLHITLRSHLRCLRSQFVFPTVRGALASLKRVRSEFRVVEFSVQQNHLHLLVEAADSRALSSGLRALGIRIARRVNRLLMRAGAVMADRFHVHELTSPRAVRRALVYVLANFRKHGVGRERIDPCSSAPYFAGFRELGGSSPLAIDFTVVPRALAPPGGSEVPTARARTWLLAMGWRRHGLISLREGPASVRR